MEPRRQGFLGLSLTQLPKQEWQAAIAAAYAVNGDRNKTLEYLEKALSEEDLELILSIRYPVFDSIRSDPRYADLMHRLGLPE